MFSLFNMLLQIKDKNFFKLTSFLWFLNTCWSAPSFSCFFFWRWFRNQIETWSADKLVNWANSSLRSPLMNSFVWKNVSRCWIWSRLLLIVDFLRTELSRLPTSLSPFILMQVIFHEATSSSCHWNQNRKKKWLKKIGQNLNFQRKWV